MTLAKIWELEAITVSVPLSVLDGSVPRWGPGFFDQAFPPDVIEQISDHARALVDFMKAHPREDPGIESHHRRIRFGQCRHYWPCPRGAERRGRSGGQLEPLLA